MPGKVNPVIATQTKNWPVLTAMLAKLARMHIPTHDFTSIYVARNLQAKEHTDRKSSACRISKKDWLKFKKNLKISIVESCTGGMLASSITSISGSSKVFSFGKRT